MAAINATPSWKSLGGWVAGIIIVAGSILILSQFAMGRQILAGQIPGVTRTS